MHVLLCLYVCLCVYVQSFARSYLYMAGCVCVYLCVCTCIRLPWWLRWESVVCNAGDPGSIPESGRSPGEGNGSPRQCSCLENPMDRGAWWVTVHGVAKSRTRLSNVTFFHMLPTQGTQETWVRSLGREDPLGEGTATLSSIPAWRGPRTGAREGRSRGSQSDTTEPPGTCTCALRTEGRHAPLPSEGQGEAQERPRPEPVRGTRPEGAGASRLL